MKAFELDHKLQMDCFILDKSGDCEILLMNNSLVPWFILVPHTGETELCNLPEVQKIRLYKNIDLLSKFILNQFKVSKINIAAIGNSVKQLHIHVIGRSPTDYCWPNVVWGRQEREDYPEKEVKNIRAALKLAIGSV